MSATEQRLDDAIRDMLDYTAGYCAPMSDAEKLAAIRKIGEKALADVRAGCVKEQP